MEKKIDAQSHALLLGIYFGLCNVLVDIGSLFTYNWSLGIPSYWDLLYSPHRMWHTPSFALVYGLFSTALAALLLRRFRMALLCLRKE